MRLDAALVLLALGTASFSVADSAWAQDHARIRHQCQSPRSPAGPGGANDRNMESAALEAERLIAADRIAAVDGAAARMAQVARALEAGVHQGAPSAAALGRYCSAAGEYMRIAPEGSQREAQSLLLAALRHSRSAGSREVTANAAYRLGLITANASGSAGLRGAAPVRKDAGDLAERLRSAQAQGSAMDQCAVLDDLGDGGEGMVIPLLGLDCAARLALDAGRADLAAIASLRLARIALDLAEFSQRAAGLKRLAGDRVLAALPIAATVRRDDLRVELLGRLVKTALELGLPRSAALEEAVHQMRSVRSGDASVKASVAEAEARLALADGRPGSARLLLERALLAESQRPLPLRLPEYYLLLAEAEPEARTRHVAAAYAALENLRPRLPRFDPLTEESIFALYMRRVFESAADVQLAANDQAGIGSAQSIVEAYRQAELLSAVGSECLPSREEVSPADLAVGETLLYPLLFPDRVELLYVTGNGTGEREYRRLPPNRSVGRLEVARLVQQLNIGIDQGGDAWRAPAAKLYALLIKPIEDQLAPGSSLAIIPDRTLRGVPFAALVDSNGQFLVERTALSVAPALAYSQPGTARGNARLGVLAASLSKEVKLPAGEFAALTGTAAEAAIAAKEGAPGILLQDFTRNSLMEALSSEPVDVLHLATHASFNGRSDRAFIVANGELIRLSELREMIAGGQARGDALSLLILSACETAVGDDDSSMGLAGAAVQAGALSAIASLWQVDDAGTAELMRNFYTHYRQSGSRAQSLRKAQLALIRQGGSNADPFVWAAFTLVGAWR